MLMAVLPQVLFLAAMPALRHPSCCFRGLLAAKAVAAAVQVAAVAAKAVAAAVQVAQVAAPGMRRGRGRGRWTPGFAGL
jgi:hypothetical protein